MKEDEVIKHWKLGKNKFQVADVYMKTHNKSAKIKKEKCINKNEALAYVEPIIFRYETKDWK